MSTFPPSPAASPLPNLNAREGHAAFATSLALLVLRLMLAATFIYHGAQNSLGWFEGPGAAKFAQHVPALPGLPAIAWAWLSALSQLVCGILMLLGLLTRLAAVVLIINMIVAAVFVHAPHGFSIVAGGYEYALALIAISLALLLTGPGLVALDALLFRRGLWARGPQPLAP